MKPLIYYIIPKVIVRIQIKHFANIREKEYMTNTHLFSVAVFQLSPQNRSIQRNLDFIEDRLSSLKDALVVLPELFLGSSSLIESVPSQELASTLGKLVTLSKSNALTLVGSIPVLENNNSYNRAIAITNGELHSIYDKVNLFNEEKDAFCQGQLIPSYLTFLNFKVSCQICLDIIDPLMANYLAHKGVEIICVPASVSIDLLPKVVQARSLENQIITLFANRCGTDSDGIKYRGESSIFLPNGQSYSLGDQKEELSILPINTSIVELMRKTRKVLGIDAGREINWKTN